MFEPYCPPPSFYFTVMVADTGAALQMSSMADAGFQEASGLEAKIETEALKEGGENRFIHQLPGVTSSPNLVLRPAMSRGLRFCPNGRRRPSVPP